MRVAAVLVVLVLLAACAQVAEPEAVLAPEPSAPPAPDRAEPPPPGTPLSTAPPTALREYLGRHCRTLSTVPRFLYADCAFPSGPRVWVHDYTIRDRSVAVTVGIIDAPWRDGPYAIVSSRAPDDPPIAVIAEPDDALVRHARMGGYEVPVFLVFADGELLPVVTEDEVRALFGSLSEDDVLAYLSFVRPLLDLSEATVSRRGQDFSVTYVYGGDGYCADRVRYSLDVSRDGAVSEQSSSVVQYGVPGVDCAG